MAVLIHIVVNFGISTTFVKLYCFSSLRLRSSFLFFLRVQMHLLASSVTISYNTGTQCRIDFYAKCTYRMYMLATSFLEPLLPKVVLALSYIYSISISINHEHSRTFMTFGFNSISEYRLLGNLFRRLFHRNLFYVRRL